MMCVFFYLLWCQELWLMLKLSINKRQKEVSGRREKGHIFPPKHHNIAF